MKMNSHVNSIIKTVLESVIGDLNFSRKYATIYFAWIIKDQNSAELQETWREE